MGSIVEGTPLDVMSDDRLSEATKATLNKVTAAVQLKAEGAVKLLEYARRSETELLTKMQVIDKDFTRYRDESLAPKIKEFKKKHSGKENADLADRYVRSVEHL